MLEALYREGGILGGEQSGHIICLRDHVTGDGLASALLLCGALEGRTLSRGCRRDGALSAGRSRTCPAPGAARSRRRCSNGSTTVNAELNGDGPRARPSVRARSRVVRVLAEAATQEEAEDLCARIAALVTQELG